MELDEMKLAWQSIDRHMARRDALDLERYRDRKLVSARVWLLPTQAGLAVQIVAGVATIVASAMFWVAHLGAPHLVVCGVLLQAYGVLLAGTAAREMQMLAGIDYAAPVLAIQRSLEQLRAWRIRLVPLWLATGSFVWIPLTLAVFEAWFRADIYAHAPEVVLWLIVSGVVALVAGCMVWRWVPGTARLFGESAVGGSLGRARKALAEIARFETE